MGKKRNFQYESENTNNSNKGNNNDKKKKKMFKNNEKKNFNAEINITKTKDQTPN